MPNINERNEEDRLQDPDQWEDEAQLLPGRRVSMVFSVRLNRDEMAEIRLAADHAGEHMSEFMRRAALTRARSARASIVEPIVTTTPPPGGSLLLGIPAQPITSVLVENKAA